jgi:hypothetical protein
MRDCGIASIVLVDTVDRQHALLELRIADKVGVHGDGKTSHLRAVKPFEQAIKTFSFPLEWQPRLMFQTQISASCYLRSSHLPLTPIS